MKKALKNVVFLLALIIVIFNTTGCKKLIKEEKTIEKKLNSEISYIDSELISILNELNNINYTKYKVEVQQNENTSTNEGGGEEEKNSTQQTGEEKNTKESGESGKQENSTEGKSSTSASSSQVQEEKSSSEGESSNSQSQANKTYTMQSNNILGKKVIINWEDLKNRIEKLYTAWTTISIDLKSVGVEDKTLNEFANHIDNLAVAIKNENAYNTMDSIIQLYDFLPKFVERYDAVNERNVLDSKYKLIYCYKYATMEDWEKLEEYINSLKMSFSNISSQKEEYKGREKNIENANVIINEIGNSSSIKDKDVFFIKYKNLMQELNIILEI